MVRGVQARSALVSRLRQLAERLCEQATEMREDTRARLWNEADLHYLEGAMTRIEEVLGRGRPVEPTLPQASRHLLLVLSDPEDGRDDEYNEWYSGVHIEETLRTPGWLTAQRFVRSDSQLSDRVPCQRYLALYEFDSANPDEALDALRQGSASMTPSTAISSDDIVAVFTPITNRIESL